MSLDVYLKRRRWISYDEGKTNTIDDETVYDSNITHNLGKMADKAGLYEALWRPYQLHPDYKEPNNYDIEMEFEESHTMYAKDVIEPLEKGLKKLRDFPERYKKFDSSNGWGVYKNLVEFTEKYLEACKEYPEAIIITSR